mgnify:CR=1 FL=1|tara:strand:+ start:6306 stop:6704 length:399 start_codon:yes stop_codon:yes gene_type:complete
MNSKTKTVIFYILGAGALAFYIFYYEDYAKNKKEEQKRLKELDKINAYKSLSNEMAEAIGKKAKIKSEVIKNPMGWTWGKPYPKFYQDQLDAIENSKSNALKEHEKELLNSIKFPKNKDGTPCIVPPCGWNP